MTLIILAFLLKIVYEFRRNNAFVTQDRTALIQLEFAECQCKDHWPWMTELRGIFLSLMFEDIFENGSNII